MDGTRADRQKPAHQAGSTEPHAIHAFQHRVHHELPARLRYAYHQEDGRQDLVAGVRLRALCVCGGDGPGEKVLGRSLDGGELCGSRKVRVARWSTHGESGGRPPSVLKVETYLTCPSCRARKLPGATEIEELTDAPGGGFRIGFQDPEGFPVNLIFGQQLAETGKLPEKLVYNFEQDKVREGAFQRFREGPAAVHKVGLAAPGLRRVVAHGRTPTNTISLRVARSLRSVRSGPTGPSSLLYSELQPCAIGLHACRR